VTQKSSWGQKLQFLIRQLQIFNRRDYRCSKFQFATEFAVFWLQIFHRWTTIFGQEVIFRIAHYLQWVTALRSATTPVVSVLNADCVAYYHEFTDEDQPDNAIE